MTHTLVHRPLAQRSDGADGDVRAEHIGVGEVVPAPVARRQRHWVPGVIRDIHWEQHHIQHGESNVSHPRKVAGAFGVLNMSVTRVQARVSADGHPDVGVAVDDAAWSQAGQDVHGARGGAERARGESGVLLRQLRDAGGRTNHSWLK